jgi:hypothetical protein
VGEASDRDRARWALRDDRKLSWRAKYAWLMLDTRGVDPHPSRGTLAADCAIDPSTVRRGLAELEAAGWLRITARTTREGDADTNQYDLICPAHEGVGAHSTHPVGAHSTHGGCTQHPEDQQGDQPPEDQPGDLDDDGDAASAQPPPPTDHDQRDGQDRADSDSVALVICALVGVYSGLCGRDDVAVVRWLHRAVYSEGHRHDGQGLARYLSRLCRAAPSQLIAIRDLVRAERDEGGFPDEETTKPLVLEARKLARRHRLTDYDVRRADEWAAYAAGAPPGDWTARAALDAAWWARDHPPEYNHEEEP